MVYGSYGSHDVLCGLDLGRLGVQRKRIRLQRVRRQWPTQMGLVDKRWYTWFRGLKNFPLSAVTTTMNRCRSQFSLQRAWKRLATIGIYRLRFGSDGLHSTAYPDSKYLGRFYWAQSGMASTRATISHSGRMHSWSPLGASFVAQYVQSFRRTPSPNTSTSS